MDFVLVSPPLANHSNEYLLKIDDCSRVKSVKFATSEVSVTSAERANNDNSCQFLYEFELSKSLNPSVVINTLDGDLSYQESFSVDTKSPQLTLENLSLI